VDIAVVGSDAELTQVARARRWSTVRRVIGLGSFPLIQDSPRLRRLCQQHLDGLIVLSRESKRLLEEVEWLSHASIQNIPNGVDLEAMDQTASGDRARLRVRGELGLSADVFLVGAVDRLGPGCGIELLIDAVAGLADRNPTMVLLIVGEGPWEEALHRRIATTGEAATRITIATESSDPSWCFPALDAFVLPVTDHRRTFSQSLIEAMASYVPVVVSDVGGLGEIVHGEQNGILVPARERDAIADSLTRLMHDGELRRRLSRNARQTIEAHFTESQMFDRLESYLSEVLL
jgi:glycosyltransferase involved in cell wall biosynthesis